MNRISELLYRAARRADNDDHAWFEQAMNVSMSQNLSLDDVIVEAVREIIKRLERKRAG